MFYPISTYNSFASSNAESAKSDAAAARMQVDLMKSDVERLLMITEALWQILKEQHGYDDNELIKRIVTIDMRDGKLDGKVAPDARRNAPSAAGRFIKTGRAAFIAGNMSP